MGEVVCVVYSINASYSSYANLKYMVNINFIKIKLKYIIKLDFYLLLFIIIIIIIIITIFLLQVLDVMVTHR
jgi:hypothetical protein